MVQKTYIPINFLHQPKKGYRYGIDSFLLARFAQFHSTDLVCDLGAGVGTLGLLALARGGSKKVVAVEVQEELASYIFENAKLLGVQDRLEILHANWKKVSTYFKPRSFHVVISNPPYHKAKSGLLPPSTSKAIAKHEIEGTMRDLLHAASYLLKPSGKFYVMYPPLRLEELILELAKSKFKIQRMAYIHPYLDRSATLVMVEAVRSPVRELCLEAPVIVYRDQDHYTPEVEAWVGKKRRV
jgi:tRNA1(Val) A37 N6-methylase TrmN6